jgi:hypothetical protein
MTALSAARERLDAYVDSVANHQILLEPARLKGLEDALIAAAMTLSETGPF